ncbi:hypothetical protein Y032_0592g398 [Ancylostoma ceylanicum]|uniref:Uncharacterized protein n=1 Tax=Ancylostoma ceylanicum TaxID=53326 RepID=A0A016WMI9_9BILA|nr:hypothetical protein Y032_0592g398 [Ancylostoma ceylanicum]
MTDFFILSRCAGRKWDQDVFVAGFSIPPNPNSINNNIMPRFQESRTWTLFKGIQLEANQPPFSPSSLDEKPITDVPDVPHLFLLGAETSEPARAMPNMYISHNCYASIFLRCTEA